MRIVTSWQRLFAVGFVLALLPVVLSAAHSDAVQIEQLTPTEKVREHLDQTIKSFKPDENWTLQDTLDYLEDRYLLDHHLKFTVDYRAFEAEKMADVKQLEIAKDKWELKNVKLKEVLQTLLIQMPVPAPNKAAYVIMGDTILVTTAERAHYHWMRQPVNLDAEKEELTSVLKKLARATGTNILLDARAAKEGRTPVSLQVHDVSLETAVSLLAEMAGLKPVRTDNVLLITTKEHAAEMRADPERAHWVGPCPLLPEKKADGE